MVITIVIFVNAISFSGNIVILFLRLTLENRWYKELFLEHFCIKSTEIQLLVIIEISAQLI